MADLKIEDATEDVDISGSELVPVSDNSTPKSVKLSTVKDYITGVLTNAVSATVPVAATTDAVLMKQGSTPKTITVSALADQILAAAFDKTVLTPVAGTELVSVEQTDGTARTVTMAALAAYLATQVTPPSIDFANLAEDTAGEGTIFPVGIVNGETGAVTVKKQTIELAVYKWLTEALCVTGYVPGYSYQVQGSASPVGSEDKIFVRRDSTGELESVKATDTGMNGNVMGASSSVQHALVRFADTTGKVIENGGPVIVESIDDNSTNAQVPTAAAVNAAALGKQDAPDAATTSGQIAVWSATNKRLSATGLVVASSIGAGTAADAVPVVGAVNAKIATAIAERVTAPASTTLGKIPQWGDSKTLTDGLTLVKSGETVTSTDAQIPTLKKIVETMNVSLEQKISIPSTTPTVGNVLKWNSVTGAVADIAVVNSQIVASTANLVTCKAVLDTIAPLKIKFMDTAPGDFDNTSGSAMYWNLGQVVYCTADKKIYLNTVDPADTLDHKAVWVWVAMSVIA